MRVRQPREGRLRVHHAKGVSGPGPRKGRASAALRSGSELEGGPSAEDVLTSKLSRRYGDALRVADASAAGEIALEGLQNGLSIVCVHARVIQPAMYWIGDLWRNGAIGVGDEHLATAISHQVLAALYPKVLEGVTHPAEGRILLAAVEGEQHALGLRMAADAFEGGGHDVLFMGADNPTTSILEAVDRYRPAAVGLSITMVLNLPALQAVLDGLASRGVRIAIGGQAAPGSGDLATPGARSIVDLPRIDDLPWAAGMRRESDELKPGFRRDQAFRSSLPSAMDNAGAELARVATGSADLARTAVRRSHLERLSPTPSEDRPADAPHKP